MNLIFIDTNIYIGFYNSNKPEYKKLIDSVIEIKDSIFITEQISFEIDRNKLNVFKNSFENYIKQVAPTSTKLPEHLDEDSSAKLSIWNKKRREIETDIKKSTKDLKQIFDELIQDIALSKDKVSTKLAPLYNKAVKPSKEEIEKGRWRREIGNPPGKRADPLGDQLSWEQLLKHVSEVKKLWIVSTDRDYYTEHNKKIYLNPVLYNDLISINPNIKINLHNTLSGALGEFSKEIKINSIPEQEELDKIIQIETGDIVRHFSPKEFFPSKPQTCPKCQSKDSFIDGGYKPSQYGGLTLQYICKECRYHYDTGFFFE